MEFLAERFRDFPPFFTHTHRHCVVVWQIYWIFLIFFFCCCPVTLLFWSFSLFLSLSEKPRGWNFNCFRRHETTPLGKLVTRIVDKRLFTLWVQLWWQVDWDLTSFDVLVLVKWNFFPPLFLSVTNFFPSSLDLIKHYSNLTASDKRCASNNHS